MERERGSSRREGEREALYLSAIYSRGGSDRGWKSDRGRVGLYKEMAVDIVNSRGSERERGMERRSPLLVLNPTGIESAVFASLECQLEHLCVLAC